MHLELEEMDDGWTKPSRVPMHQLEMVDDAVEYLGDQDVYISTVYEFCNPEEDALSYVGGIVCSSMVDVRFCPESPGALEQLQRIIHGIDISSRN